MVEEPDESTNGTLDESHASDVKHWTQQQQLPQHLQKYWSQRYKIWERYDEEIWMTPDAWFGVTPEPIANQIAVHIAEAVPEEKTWIVDAFAGVGGNAIAFARSGRWERVFAIEKDAKTLECARHNAQCYGVAGKIHFSLGDCFELLEERFTRANNIVIFGSPPWGGTEYGSEEVFDLSKMQPYNLKKLYNVFSKYSDYVVLYLPRTSDLNQLARYGSKETKLEVSHYCMQGASKALCVWYGDFDFPADEYDDSGEIDEDEDSGETDSDEDSEVDGEEDG